MQNSTQQLYQMGFQFYQGNNGVTKNFHEAVRCWQAAIAGGNSMESGYADAQYMLGLCYENATGIEQDIKKASECYKCAAMQGDNLANSRLKELHQKYPSLTNLKPTILVNNAATTAIKEDSLAVNNPTAPKTLPVKFSINVAALREALGLPAPNPKIKLEQEEIDANPKLTPKQKLKLKHYQVLMERELTNIMINYWVASANILKMEENNKAMVINGINSIPVAGSCLKIITAALTYVNDRSHKKQINPLGNMFSNIHEIEEICHLFARQATLMNQKRILMPPAANNTYMEKLKNTYEDAKTIIAQFLQDKLPTRNRDGITLEPEEKLAVLDITCLLEQILGGAPIQTKNCSHQNISDQFMLILTGSPFRTRKRATAAQNPTVEVTANLSPRTTTLIFSKLRSQKPEEHMLQENTAVIQNKTVTGLPNAKPPLPPRLPQDKLLSIRRQLSVSRISQRYGN